MSPRRKFLITSLKRFPRSQESFARERNVIFQNDGIDVNREAFNGVSLHNEPHFSFTSQTAQPNATRSLKRKCNFNIKFHD